MLLTPASRPPGAVQTDSVGKDGGGSLRDETIVTQPAIKDPSTRIKGRARRVFKKEMDRKKVQRTSYYFISSLWPYVYWLFPPFHQSPIF